MNSPGVPETRWSDSWTRLLRVVELLDDDWWHVFVARPSVQAPRCGGECEHRSFVSEVERGTGNDVESGRLHVVGTPWGMRIARGERTRPREGAGRASEAFSLVSGGSQRRTQEEARGFHLSPFRCIAPSQRHILCAREELKLSSVSR